MPRSRRRTGSPCTANDSWFGAAKTATVVTIELAQERRTLLLDRAITAVVDQNAEFEVRTAAQSSWRAFSVARRSRRHDAHARPDLYASERVIQAQVRPWVCRVPLRAPS